MNQIGEAFVGNSTKAGYRLSLEHFILFLFKPSVKKSGLHLQSQLHGYVVRDKRKTEQHRNFLASVCFIT